MMNLLTTNQSSIKQIKNNQANFPKLLNNIYHPIPQLWYRGNLALANQNNLLAVVGSRQSSWYGQLIINRLLDHHITSQLVIVSGLAVGIDSLAHQASLNSNNPTIAVLGSGLDSNSIYPPSNWQLAEKIVNSGGLLLSEYPPGQSARNYHFPQRNRIIAGLSAAVLVIEAAAKSGALITAELALQEGRTVLAVPGNINQTLSAGTNKLIQLGAQAILDSTDLAIALDLPQSTSYSKTNLPITDCHLALLKLLTKPLSLDELLQITHQSVSQISQQLTDLELGGHIKQQADQTYVAC
ncbi:MAG TPA: DNA-processing protein DprA [bacterium]|nr:DNA-processing protein DprA [bacterium]HOH85566.1 DNA-processing protein DprA [bacterium]